MTLSVERARSGREPFFVAELYLPQCQRTFGVQPCTGTGEPCYKTLASCKSVVSAYDPIDKAYVFCSARQQVPFAIEGAVPCLDSVEQTPARIGASGTLGQRGVVSITFNDLTHNDVGFDPHYASRAYDPLSQGTLFGKLRARHLYYSGRKLVVKIGYLTEGGEYLPENFRSFTYFIESFEGPDKNGKFKILAKDLLKQLDSERAQCPAPNVGRLKDAITSADTTATLYPAGIGDADYPTFGLMVLGGEEIVGFDRVGDALTLYRAQQNTVAIDHDADELAQVCKEYTSQTVQNIIYSLLVDFAGVPAVYINKAEWDAEQAAYLPRLYTSVLAVPTSVKTLVNELLEQTATLLWWDEEEAKLRFKSLRALSDDAVATLGEWSHVLRDTLDIKEDPAARLTQVWVWYGARDPTKAVDEKANYKLRHVASDPDAEQPMMYGDKRVKEIFSRWITAGNASAAIDLGDKYLARYRRTPRIASFSLDEKDGAIKPGDFVQLSSYRLQKFDGTSEPINMQILSRKFKKVATQTDYTGTEFFYLVPQVGPSGNVERSIIIAAPNDAMHPTDSQQRLAANLRALHDSIYADLNAGDVVRFRVLSGAGFYRSTRNARQPALHTGAWPAGVKVFIDLDPGSFVAGAAGKGAIWNEYGVANSLPGEDGGSGIWVDASLTPLTCTITANAPISGGAGGGASLNTPFNRFNQDVAVYLGGGGAHGILGGASEGGLSFDPGAVLPWPQSGETVARIPASIIGYNLEVGQTKPPNVPGTTVPYGSGYFFLNLYNFSGPAVQYLHTVSAGNGGIPGVANGVGGGFPIIQTRRVASIFDAGTVVQTLLIYSSGLYTLPIGDGGVTKQVQMVMRLPGKAGWAIYGKDFCTLEGSYAAALRAEHYGPII